MCNVYMSTKFVPAIVSSVLGATPTCTMYMHVCVHMHDNNYCSPAFSTPSLCLICCWPMCRGSLDLCVCCTFSQVILCTKEVNEKTRILAFKLLIKLGYTAQKSQDKKADGNACCWLTHTRSVPNHLCTISLT